MKIITLLNTFGTLVVSFAQTETCPPCPENCDRLTRHCVAVDEFRVQLRWLKSAQFAGYYAAEALGYWEQDCLRVTLLSPDSVEDNLGRLNTSAVPHATIPWYLTHQIMSFEGDPLLRVSQYFRRSGIRWFTSPVVDTNKTRGVQGFKDLSGVQWCLPRGNTVNTVILTLLRMYNKTACNYNDVVTEDTVPCQGSEDIKFLPCGYGIEELLGLVPGKKAHVTHGLSYDQVGQLLASVINNRLLVMNEDFYVFNPTENSRVVHVEDGLTVNKTWVDQGENWKILVRFLKGLHKGWIYCRDNPEDCVSFVSPSGENPVVRMHQRYMMHEVADFPLT